MGYKSNRRRKYDRIRFRLLHNRLLFDTLPTARAQECHAANGVISGAVDAISTNEATTRTGIALSDIAFYNNTNDDSGMGDNGVNNKISCTADPYENSATGDFRPNTTAGGGALLQAAAGFAAGTLTSGRDIGALQHADPAGGGLITPTLAIGI